MFKRLLAHLKLALIFFGLTLVQQYLFYYVQDIPIIWLTFEKYFATFAFFIAATFIRGAAVRYFFLSFVMILNTFQMGHLSYFGTQILPNEIFLLFTQFHEVSGTLGHEVGHVFIALLFSIVPLVLGWFALKRYKNLFEPKFMVFIFLFYFIYNPTRTFVTGNTWGRQPSTQELGGMNVYLSFSYFMGKILPHKLTQDGFQKSPNASLELIIEKSHRPEWDKIIFILGESLTPHHMELFGYERPTTPFLEGLKDSNHFFHTVGLSSGVSTDIAVAFLLNLGFGSGGSIKAAKGEHCLFKLAKLQDYSTHFLSIQSAQQLRYIAPYLCASSLDEYKTLENISPGTVDHQAARDRDLLPGLQKLVDLDNKQFILLHQRGSHAPWGLRSTPDSNKYQGDSKTDHYDNSVIEFDLFMKDLHHIVHNSKKKILVIYVSDHGEGLGQDGVWGHGMLAKTSIEVPLMIMSFNKPLSSEVKKLPKYVPHYNVALVLAKEMGFKLNQDPLEFPKNYVVYGNDIDGFAGTGEITFTDDSFEMKVIP